MRNLAGGRQVFSFGSQISIICQDSPATTGGDGLIAIEAEGAQKPEGAGVLLADITAQRLCRIFDHNQMKV